MPQIAEFQNHPIFALLLISMGIHVQKFTFNPFQENTYVIHDGSSCVIVDPGCFDRNEQLELTGFISKNNLTPLALLQTHAHIDHVLGCHFVIEKYDLDFYIHQEDLPTLTSVPTYAHVYGFPGYNPPKEPNKILHGGELLKFGEIELKVLFTPGHCPGHVVYYCEKEGFVINGDVLFAGSFGRVDLPGGNLETLKRSIFDTMFKLPEETLVYSGHGPETTIGTEMRSNYIHQF